MYHRLPILFFLLFTISCSSSSPSSGARPVGQPGSKFTLTPAIDFDGDYHVEVIDVDAFFVATAAPVDKRQLGALRLVSGADQLYVSGLTPGLLILNNEGQEMQGSGDIKAQPGLLALSVWQNELAAVSPNEVVIWRDGVVADRFSLPDSSHFPDTTGFSPRRFVFDDRRVLVPWSSHTEAGVMGTLYDRSGKFLKQIVDPNFDKNLLGLSQLTRTSLWDREGEIWYQAYMFHPKLALYDPDMDQITTFRIDSPAILEYEHYFFAEDRTGIPNPNRKQPLFSDFAVFDKIGFLLGNGMLHRIELHSGEVIGRYRFRAPNHPRLREALQLKFTTLALRSDGSLVLGGGPAGNELFTSKEAVFAGK